MTTDAKKDEREALKARVAELERATKPPEPYITDWQMPPPAIDRVSMSPSAMREMAQAVPTSLIRDVVGDNIRAPQGPTSQGAPSSQTVSHVHRPVGTGWVEPAPLSNPPGTHLVDALCIVDDLKQRAERKR
jgi:hypothetical protein